MLTSLKGRLTFAASLILLVFLGLLGLALETAFRQTLSEAKQRELRLHTHSLLVAANPSENSLELPSYLPDDRFNFLGSGLCAVIMNADRARIWRSESTADATHAFLNIFTRGESNRMLAVGVEHFGRQLAPPNKTSDVGTQGDSFALDLDPGLDQSSSEFFVYEHVYAWQTLDGSDRLFIFQILEDSADFEMQVASFRAVLWRWMLIIGLVMVLVLWGALFWTLRPLRKIAVEVSAIEVGELDELSEAYPTELRGITQNLNFLLNNEQRQRERYRQTLSDLAHSLKTPLAILYGIGATPSSKLASDDEEQHAQVQEQVERMNEIVTYQLQRAVVSNPGSILASISVQAPAEKILKALRKVYADKSTHVTASIDATAGFYGDAGDFMEVLGNLLDNAYKHGGDEIKLSIQSVSRQNSDAGRPGLLIKVEDSGVGIAQDQQDRLFARGQRADTREQGQGIGLAVVKDIVTSYGGKITLSDSNLGGVCFQLLFP